MIALLIVIAVISLWRWYDCRSGQMIAAQIEARNHRELRQRATERQGYYYR